MTASQFIEKLQNSGNKLLDGVAKDLMDWSKLKHNKECLELFLSHNIAVVFVENGGAGEEYLVSSNPTYLTYLNGQRVERNKNKVVRILSSSPKFAKIFKSSNQKIVRTWNLIKNNKLEIPMTGNWAIRRWELGNQTLGCCKQGKHTGVGNSN